MSDPALAALLGQSPAWPGPLLWFADEQCHGFDPAPLQRHDCQVISNRYDVFRRLTAAGIAAHFSDFDTTELATAGFASIGYRVSKEKAVVHHLVNASRRLLAPQGKLWLAGARGEGIRTYLDKTGRLFGDRAAARKQDGFWLGHVRRAAGGPGLRLDDQDYSRLRRVAEADGVTLISKPGVFGWDRIDPGSRLLIERLPDFLSGFRQAPHSLLDLGCGYGYLAAAAGRRHPFDRIVATDNNAAALLACRATLAHNGIAGTVAAGDCGDTLTEPFDTVLCNPPFHRGFGGDQALTDRFLAGCARLLVRTGRALFVVNSFLPLEQRAQAYFRQVTIVADNRRFKLIALTGARQR